VDRMADGMTMTNQSVHRMTGEPDPCGMDRHGWMCHIQGRRWKDTCQTYDMIQDHSQNSNLGNGDFMMYRIVTLISYRKEKTFMYYM
jgi:hypothetical protein